MAVRPNPERIAVKLGKIIAVCIQRVLNVRDNAVCQRTMIAAQC